MKKTLTTLTIVALLTAVCTGESMTPVSVTGNAAIRQEGNNWNITTTAKKSVINWNSFDVADGAVVHFEQPSARSSVLNRVTGASVSRIDGLLSSNGRVYLLNPNGIIIGPGGVIRVAEFVGSTLALSDSQFLAGKDMNFAGSSQAAIVNYGTIDAIGGDVYLIAANVANHGSITAPNGSANLVAANDVLLTQDHQIFIRPGTGTGDGIGVENSGTIDAAVARLLADGNMYALAINNSGVVRANGIASVDGRVMLIAQGGSIVNTGTIAAKNGQAGGEVRIIGDSLTLRGEIIAAGTSGGGLIETSAPVMDLTGLTLSAGPGGVWLLDPPLVIDSALGASIGLQLSANTNVVYTGQTGITVTGDIIASPSSTSTYLWLGSTSTIAINANIDVGIGRLYLQAANGVTQGAGTTLKAENLLITASSGIFRLDQPTNDFGTVAAVITGTPPSGENQLWLRDANSLTIGIVRTGKGISVRDGEVHIVTPNGFINAKGAFQNDLVTGYHALGNVTLGISLPDINSPPESADSFEIRIYSTAAGSGPTDAKSATRVREFMRPDGSDPSKGLSASELAALDAEANFGYANAGSSVYGSAVRLVLDPTKAGELAGYNWRFKTQRTYSDLSPNSYSFVSIEPAVAVPARENHVLVSSRDNPGEAKPGDEAWDTNWSLSPNSHTLDRVNPYVLNFATMNTTDNVINSVVYLRSLFLDVPLPPPPPPTTEAFIFDRIIDHVEDFPHLRPLVRVSNVGSEILAPVLDEVSTYFDRAAQKTDHRYYYQSVGSIYQIPR